MGILRVLSNEQLANQEAAQEREREQQEDASRQLMLDALTAHLRDLWDAAVRAKAPIEQIMLASLRQRNGEYEPDKLAEIKKTGGSTEFVQLTEVKCRAAESWLRDILLDDGMPPWDIRPTPVPDLPDDMEAALNREAVQRVLAMAQAMGEVPEVQRVRLIRSQLLDEFRQLVTKEAEERARRMKRRISDQLVQARWAEAFDAFLSDLVTFPAAFIKGPVVRQRRVLDYGADGDVIVTTTLAPEYERVSPFDIFPEPGIESLEDGWVFERRRLPRADLSRLIGVPFYNADVIREVLLEGAKRQVSWYEQAMAGGEERDDEERKFSAEEGDTVEVLEFWGELEGKLLREFWESASGLANVPVIDDAKFYPVSVVLAGGRVIKAVVNSDPLGEKPYAKTCFMKVPGAFWGRGIPEIMADIQAICNAAVRALVNNMGIASGPQVEVNLDRLPVGMDIETMFPWKIWQVRGDLSGGSAPAVRFTQPDSRAAELMSVYEVFARMADEHTGIPAYLSGDLNVRGAGRTASGLSMLMGNAGKSIRQVVSYIDKDIVAPVLRRHYRFNMRFFPDPDIKGDLEIVPRGAINLAVREADVVRMLEFLQFTANPLDAAIVKPNGRAELLRHVARQLGVEADRVIPADSELQINDLATRAAQAQGGVGIPPGEPAALDQAGDRSGGLNVLRNAMSGR